MRLLFRAADVRPEYTERRCLAVLQSRSACKRCLEVCPHEAVRIGRRVEIDEVDCTGCGLCVQVCPSEALEPQTTFESGHDLRCSRVAGEAQSVHCLGRLQPSDLLRLAGGRERVTLARGDCGDCPIGTATVTDAIATVAAEAAELAASHGRSLEVEQRETERFDERGLDRRVSRRELLRGGWRGAQRGAARALAPLDPGDPDDDSLPGELQRRYRILELADLEPDTPVPWALPRVAEGCILCPVCTNVCPTKAFGRTFGDDPDDQPVLELDPERCLDCGACVAACPVGVIAMEGPIAWSELSEGRSVAYLRAPDAGPTGTVSR